MNDIKARFRELAEHLKTKGKLLNIRPENYQTDIVQFMLCPGGHNITPQGLYLANFRYRASLYVERIAMPAAITLMIHARAWLDDNDDTRDKYKLADPEISIIELDDGDLVDLLLTGEFIDPVYLAPAPEGTPDAEIIEWNGRRYTVAEYDLWIAERGEVNGGPTDV